MSDGNLPILEVHNLNVSFTGADSVIKAVRDVSFVLRRGQCLGLVGESGSGKSVTSLSVLQLLRTNKHAHTEGMIDWCEGSQKEPLLNAPEERLYQIRGKKIAMVFQEPMSSLNPVIRCGKQVLEVMLVHDLYDPSERQQQVMDLFRQVSLDEPERVFRAYPHELSGGQLQRVNIAMALAGNPDVLICDEPTTALDVTVQKEIIELLKKLVLENQLAMIFVSHDLDVVAELCDSVLVMYDGQIVEQGALPGVFSSPSDPYTRALLQCKPRLDLKNVILPTVNQIVSGTYIKTQRPLSTIQTDKTALSVRDLRVRFPLKSGHVFGKTRYFHALKGVNFDVMQGEVLGIVGESGSGKSTIANCIAGLVRPYTGQMSYLGKDVTSASLSKDRQLRRSIQLIFQDPYGSLNPRMKVGDAIAEPIQYHKLRQGKSAVMERVHELLDAVGLGSTYADRYPHELSGGQRQRVSIARSLSVEPSLLICDESVSALDVSVQAQILNLLDTLRHTLQLNMIFISHDLAVVHYISDRILVLYEGQVVETGSPDEIIHRPQQAYTKKLIDSIPGSHVVF